ncbi:hypothetical protein ANCCEY_01411 [Ancylostoma ceylanicum]|uniref:Uncharacterized protein n=1 Tax=Ancylostoma ceylanicum TaxID=53326 RepID=A0A0D6M5R0_9BILA|nr:hypothetical protein ANCCEY_01411 [Ancylostoma ceylanicum]
MSTGETRWQLFNQCSKAMLQTYLGHINTRGVSSRLCLRGKYIVDNGLQRESQPPGHVSTTARPV